MKYSERRLGDERSAVYAHAAYAFGNPCRVAREEFVILLDSHELDYSQLHYELVDELLSLNFGENAPCDIPFDIYVEEGGISADGHRRAVLILYRAEIAEVKCLNGLLCGGRRLRDILAVYLRHLLEVAERLNLLGQFLPVPDPVGGHVAVDQVLILLLLLDEIVNAVERYSAVISDYSAPSVCVGKTCENVRRARPAHFGRVCVIYAVVVRLAVLGEYGLDLGVELVAVHVERLLSHLYSAEGLQRALEGLVRLETDYLFELLVDIACAMAREGGHDLGIRLEHAACLPLLCGEIQNLSPQLFSRLGRACEEGIVSLIGGIVALNEIAYVYFVVAPFAGVEPLPLLIKHLKLSCKRYFFSGK